jgi:hypothetical protein
MAGRLAGWLDGWLAGWLADNAASPKAICNQFITIACGWKILLAVALYIMPRSLWFTRAEGDVNVDYAKTPVPGRGPGFPLPSAALPNLERNRGARGALFTLISR